VSASKQVALVTGSTGQVASYLIPLLLEEGYRYVVCGLRRVSCPNKSRLQDCLDHPRLHFTECELTDPWSVYRAISETQPTEVYNLGAMSFVAASFKEPQHTTQATYLGAVNVLEAVSQINPEIKVYQASSSEMYGSSYSERTVFDRPMLDESNWVEKYQDEQTPFTPNSPYAIAKLAAHHAVRLARSRGLFACTGIVFNTESERRGEEFVTRKITRYVGRLRAVLDNGGALPALQLGNTSAYRDWSHCLDTARGIYAIMQHHEPDDFCLATGQSNTVDRFLQEAFAAADISDYKDFVTTNNSGDLRPCEVPYLCGLAEKARRVLGWSPTIFLPELVKRMVQHDIELARHEHVTHKTW
jgi:GDPmannose 4,6-dehydratase